MAYSELIKNFDKIRGYMRQFFVFGFKGRSDFRSKSQRSYDNERRRLESWLKDYMAFYQDPSGKKAFISAASREIPHNPFYEAFKAKSFTAGDITFHFIILDMLSGGNKMTVNEIISMFYDEYFSHADIKSLPDESTIRKKLREYVKLGLLLQNRRGREAEYSIPPDIICLEQWRNAIEFYSETAPLGVIGSYLCDRFAACGINVSGAFRFKHHYFLHALDMQVMHDILSAMRDKKATEIFFVNSHGNMKRYVVLPVKIYISSQTGRQYLLAWHYVMGKPHFYRIDYIRNVKAGNKEKKYEKYLAWHENFSKALWGVSFYDDCHTEHIEMTVKAGQGEEYIIQRLEREKRNGKVEKIAEGEYKYSADVYDSLEMLPWIRTFIGRIISLKCSNAMLKQRFNDDIRLVAGLYPELEAEEKETAEPENAAKNPERQQEK